MLFVDEGDENLMSLDSSEGRLIVQATDSVYKFTITAVGNGGTIDTDDA